MASEAQDSTPYVDALLAYSARDPGRFQVPGHKGGPGADPAMRALVGQAFVRATWERLGVVDAEGRAATYTGEGCLEWAGVAVFKKTHELFRKHGYRLPLLSAAFRNHMQWSELIGADAVISPPSAWQKRFNASDVEVRTRIDDPVDPRIVKTLLAHFPDFRRAYEEDGLSIDEFDSFAPTVRTLRQFIGACADLDALVRQMHAEPGGRS